MSLQPAPGPVGDPFFARVRRRHPGIDLVLLPPEPEAEVEVETTPEVGARQTLEDDLAVVAEAWRTLVGDDDAPALRRGTRPGTACARVRVVHHDTTDPLPDLGRTAEAHGWRVRRSPGPVARLVAVSPGGSTLEASYAVTQGVAIVQVSGPDNQVGAARARLLTGGR